MGAFFLLISCNLTTKHKSAEEVYQSGKIETPEDFILVKENDSAVRDTFQYKYDTNLLVQRDYFGNRESIKVDAFYYKNRPVGKWIYHSPEGKIRSIIELRDGRRNYEMLIFHENEAIKNRITFINDVAVSLIEYDTSGKKVVGNEGDDQSTK